MDITKEDQVRFDYIANNATGARSAFSTGNWQSPDTDVASDVKWIVEVQIHTVLDVLAMMQFLDRCSGTSAGVSSWHKHYIVKR